MSLQWLKNTETPLQCCISIPLKTIYYMFMQQFATQNNPFNFLKRLRLDHIHNSPQPQTFVRVITDSVCMLQYTFWSSVDFPFPQA